MAHSDWLSADWLWRSRMIVFWTNRESLNWPVTPFLFLPHWHSSSNGDSEWPCCYCMIVHCCSTHCLPFSSFPHFSVPALPLIGHFLTIDSNAFTWLFEGQRPPRPYRAPLWLHSPLSALSRCMRVLKCGVWVHVGDHDLQVNNWINHWANRKSSTELRNSSVLNPIIKSALSTCLHSSLATSLSYSHEERIIWIFTIAIVFHNQPEFVSIDRIDVFQQCRYQFYY